MSARTVGEWVAAEGQPWPYAEGSAARPPRSRRERVIRLAAIGVLVADVLAPPVTAGLITHHRPDPVPPVGRVVDSRCIDGHVDQSIDDGNPSGLLAVDTGQRC